MGNEANKYSVLMAVYYKEKPINLMESIDSMLSQTVPPSEILIVKDGHLTLELDKVLHDYSIEHEDLFTFIQIPECQGLGNALNVGVARCKYEFIARMDSDDIAVPHRCKKQLERLNDLKLSIIGSNVAEFVDNIENITSYRNVPEKHEEIVEFARRRSPFNHPSVMFKKSDVLACGNYNDWPKCQDYDLFIRMLAQGCQAYNTQENLLYMRSDNLYNKRKSKTSYKFFVKSRRTALQLGIAKWYDYLISVIAQTVIYIIPTAITRRIYKKFLRRV